MRSPQRQAWRASGAIGAVLPAVAPVPARSRPRGTRPALPRRSGAALLLLAFEEVESATPIRNRGPARDASLRSRLYRRERPLAYPEATGRRYTATASLLRRCTRHRQGDATLRVGACGRWRWPR